jgi:hypothetical protein
MANGNGDGGGDRFRVTPATLMIILAVGSPIAGLSVGGYMLREQVKINAAQAVTIDKMERENWQLQYDVKRLREDVDNLLLLPEPTPVKKRVR